jgi:hypothetical protein
MPVLQPKRNSGQQTSIALRQCQYQPFSVLLHMCLAKWQTQYGLTEKTTPVNTRALLLVIEKIKNNTEVETKPPSMIKPKGADGKHKMESIDSCIPKKSKQVPISVPKKLRLFLIFVFPIKNETLQFF